MNPYILKNENGFFHLYLSNLEQSNPERFRLVFPLYRTHEEAIRFKRVIISKMTPYYSLRNFNILHTISDFSHISQIEFKLKKSRNAVSTTYQPDEISVNDFYDPFFVKTDSTFLLLTQFHDTNSYLNIQGLHIIPNYENCIQDYPEFMQSSFNDLYFT